MLRLKRKIHNWWSRLPNGHIRNYYQNPPLNITDVASLVAVWGTGYIVADFCISSRYKSSLLARLKELSHIEPEWLNTFAFELEIIKFQASGEALAIVLKAAGYALFIIILTNILTHYLYPFRKLVVRLFGVFSIIAVFLLLIAEKYSNESLSNYTWLCFILVCAAGIIIQKKSTSLAAYGAWYLVLCSINTLSFLLILTQ